MAVRRGEVAGLRWRGVDLDGKAAFISQQLQQYDGHLAVCPPKTAHSVRVIALDRTTAAALRAHRDREHARLTKAHANPQLSAESRGTGSHSRRGSSTSAAKVTPAAGKNTPPSAPLDS